MQRLKLSEILRNHRENVLRMNIRTFASSVGLSTREVRALESGIVKNPRVETMDKISSFTGLSKYEIWAALRREQP